MLEISIPVPGRQVAGAPTPQDATDQAGPFTTRTGRASSHLPRLQLSGSRPPRLGRPSGPSHAIGYADPRPGDHSPGCGAYEEEGERAGQPGRTIGIRSAGQTSEPKESSHGSLRDTSPVRSSWQCQSGAAAPD